MWKQCQTVFFWAPKSLQMMTAGMKLKDAYSLEGKMTNLDSILKSRDITLSTKVCLVKAMVFPVVMYACESWTIKKAECWRIDTFALLEKTLESPLDCKKISPECSLEGLILKLKLQYFGHPDAKCWLIWKDPAAGKDWGLEEKGTTEKEMVWWHTHPMHMGFHRL